ncbi:PKP2 [Candida oxycetoniae]|uniref:Protein-serine/threonine kinase n=1 Tax=Candida oxycetoniae TaxID=497107 RepID=A0AAI9WYR3_9ASCO|nr:PKP2 [Candida oxycetoniae]KAI3405408.2 PKP2 [Candida oxycetoniae]
MAHNSCWRHIPKRFNSQYTSPPISPFSYIHVDALSDNRKEVIAKHLKELGPFPTYSNILNSQHFYQNTVLLDYLKKKPHPISLRQLAGYGNVLTKQKIVSSANFVRIELPIRLAMRIRDLQTLPFGVVNNYHLAQVYESYYHSFDAFRKIPQIHTIEENERFCKTLSTLLDDHLFNLSHLMMGALEVSIAETLPQRELDTFMSSMLRSRISRRVIVEEHLSLSENYQKNPYAKKPPHYLGEIFQNCRAVDHFNQVSEMAKESMSQSFPEIKQMPNLEFEGNLNCSFQFMVPHLHYILYEIIRNSFEATIETHAKKGQVQQSLPPVKVTIVDSKKEVLFRISDQGGGINREKLKLIWSFGKSPELARKSLANFHKISGLPLNSRINPATMPSSEKQNVGHMTSSSSSSSSSSLSSSSAASWGTHKHSTLQRLMDREYEHKLGMGLPLSSVYADYWNGNLQMNSIEGYGCDTALTLSKLGYHTNVVQLDRA